MTIKRTWSLEPVKRAETLKPGYSEKLVEEDRFAKTITVVSETVLIVRQSGYKGPITTRLYADDINKADLTINKGWGRKVEFGYTPNKER